MSTRPDLRPTWAEIDLDAFAGNVATIADSLPSGSRLIAVLKADGYGHGALELARRCSPQHVAMIATSLLEEALELKTGGIVLPLLVLGPLTAAQIPIAADAGIRIGVIGPEELAMVCQLARDRDVSIDLKLDSGMGRMGIVESDLGAVIGMLQSSPRVKVEAAYTHYASADDDEPFTTAQSAKFDKMLLQLRAAGIAPSLHHMANSAATLRGVVRPGDYARCGIALFGAESVIDGRRRTQPVMRWRTEIARLKDLPAATAVGYGTTFHTSRPSRIATLPVGYADGYDRRLSNRAQVLLRGRRVPVVGRVSMDLLTIDVTDLPDAAMGDEVILLGADGDERITAEELASLAGTISYEIFCRVSARVPRLFRDADGSRLSSRFTP